MSNEPKKEKSVIKERQEPKPKVKKLSNPSQAEPKGDRKTTDSTGPREKK